MIATMYLSLKIIIKGKKQSLPSFLEGVKALTLDHVIWTHSKRILILIYNNQSFLLL